VEEAEKELLKGERRELCRLHAIRLTEIDGRLSRLDLALYGNGDPEKGILWIAKNNNITLNWIAKLCFGTLAIVTANILTKIYPAVLHFLAGKI